MKLSAIVTASPSELRQPALRPGETLIQYFIRHNAEEWRKETERLTTTFGLSAPMVSALRNGTVDDASPVQAEVHRLMNDYLPRPLRTIRGLDELRKTFEQMPPNSRHELEILCPRQSSAGGDRTTEASMEKLGAKIIPLTSAGGSLDLALVLPHAQGDFLWTVPGGTRIAASDTAKKIERVLTYFLATPTCALYQDGSYSMILRTAALKDLADKGQVLSINPEKILQQLRAAGHKASRDQGKDDALCILEPEFSSAPKTSEPVEAAKPWWKNILGK